MKNLIIICFIFISLVSCTESNKKADSKNEDKTEKSKLEVNLNRAKSKYVCPMTECERGYSDEKTTCPDCGMKLVLNKDYVDPDSTLQN